MTTNYENSGADQPTQLESHPTAPQAAPKPDGLEQFFKFLFLVLFGVPLIAFIAWQWGRQGLLVSSRPIGMFISMSGPGGLQGRVVIESSTASYRHITLSLMAHAVLVALRVKEKKDHPASDSSH